MAANETTVLAAMVSDHEKAILPEWVELQKRAGTLQTGRITEAELPRNPRSFCICCAPGWPRAAPTSPMPPTSRRAIFSPIFALARAAGLLADRNRDLRLLAEAAAVQCAQSRQGLSPADVAKATVAVTMLLDELGLYTFEIFQKSREEVILRQQREITELSTPVVKLWDGILALPLIGTLDSERTQVVMENLLQHIVDDGAEIAIIDITGVPTVDTLTAQHLLKTVAAARLMGADCIISGIRPQIAQTIVHLGVELNVVSKATLADAFAVALRRTGRTVTKIKVRRPARAQGRSLQPKGRVTMDRIPILKLGDALLVTIQVDMHDRLATALEEDLTTKIVAFGAKGVLIDISALEIVDSFIGRMLDNIAAVSRILDAETVVVGMRPAVAITLVELGLSLSGVKTALNVERGMALIQSRLGEVRCRRRGLSASTSARRTTS